MGSEQEPSTDGGRTHFEEFLDLDTEDVSLKTVREKLVQFETEFQEEYVDGGQKWHAPEYWWSQRVTRLRSLIEHKIERERYEELLDDER